MQVLGMELQQILVRAFGAVGVFDVTEIWGESNDHGTGTFVVKQYNGREYNLLMVHERIVADYFSWEVRLPDAYPTLKES
jgi:hypothetical protein